MKRNIISSLFGCLVSVTIVLHSNAQYCQPVQPTNNVYAAHFTTATDVENISNINFLKQYNGNVAYENLTATQKVTQYAGLSFSWTNNMPSIYTDYTLGVWIDWDNSMTFDANEQVHATTNAGSYRSGTVTIAANQTPGLYRMRMRMIVGPGLADLDPCTDMPNIQGAVLDFTVEVLTAPSCWPVSAVTLGTRTNTTANISWTPSANGGTAWDISWGTIGYTPGDAQEIGMQSNLSSPTATITGLSIDQSFDVYVRTNCTSSDQSVWEKLTFKNGYCQPVQPTNNVYAAHFTTATDVENISNINFLKQYNGNVAYENLTATQKVTQYAGLSFSWTNNMPSIYTDYTLGVWIDWDNSMTFDANEQVHATTNAGSYRSGTVTIAANQTPGLYRMRMRMIVGPGLADLDPCTDMPNIQGAVLDFTVEVLGSCITNAGSISGATSLCTTHTTTLSSDGDANGTWHSSDNNIATVNQSGVVTGINNGSVSITYIVGIGACQVTSEPHVLIVTNSITPTFDPIADFCKGTTAPILQTTSTNTTPISGTWNPPTIDNQASGTYIFTPTEGTCATTTSLDVTVTEPTAPTFPAISAFCKGATAPSLQASSNEGISGTWNPATIDNQANGTYTFTPASGQCATTTSVTVTVNDQIVPTFPIISAFCKGATAPSLEASSNEGISGTWKDINGNIVTSADNQASGTYTFTPASGQCATTTSVTVTVNEPTAPTIVGADEIEVGENATYEGLPVSGVWTDFDNDIATFVNGVLTAKQIGEVTLTYTIKNLPCESVAVNKTVKVISKAFSNIHDFDFISDITLSPNPTSDQVNIYFSLQQASDISIEIIDLNGEILHATAFKNATIGTNTTTLNLETYAKGIYLLVLRSAKGQTTKKIAIE